MNDPGSLYRTEIDVTPESLLDWDKPLSEQSEAVRNAVQDIAANGDARFTDQQLSKLNESLLSTESGNNRGQSIVGILGDDYSVDPQSVDSAYSAAARSFKEYDYSYETALEDIKGAYPDAKPEELEWALKKEYGIGGRAGASSALSDRGIKGIKYLDGDSRAAGDGSSNYVIFDDSLINIAERGNADPRLLAGTAAGTALGALAAPMVKDSGMISSPRAGWLWDTTMALRDVERRLEGNPASLLFPSGLVDYLETTNRREEKPNAETAAWALLDVLPW